MSGGMPASDVYVSEGAGGDWIVSKRARSLARYENLHGAMAFARALAHSRRVEVVVERQDGSSTRHAGASLTYPRDL
jgi:hypothetical protein